MSLIIDADVTAACRQSLLQGSEVLPLAIIGGSGLDNFPGAQVVAQASIITPCCDEAVTVYQLALPQANGAVVYFLPRHKSDHSKAPHLINYRANIWALKALQVEQIIAINAVGGIDPSLPPGSLCLVSDVIDYSHGRQATFFDGELYPLDHVDCSELFSVNMNSDITQVADLRSGFCYGCTQGPRLETPAEISRLKADGCHLVGMTAMPEAHLAAEAHISYTAIAMVVNWAAGLSDEPITMDEIYSQLQSCTKEACAIICAYCAKLSA